MLIMFILQEIFSRINNILIPFRIIFACVGPQGNELAGPFRFIPVGDLNFWALGLSVQPMPFVTSIFIGLLQFEARNLHSLFHLHSRLLRGNI